MKTDVEFWKEHSGHEKEVEGQDWGDTPHISSGGLGTVGTAECPLCGTEEEVKMTGTICHKHDYGEHISLTCKKCGVGFHTKNIDSIGARTIFPNDRGHDCEHGLSDLEHVCE